MINGINLIAARDEHIKMKSPALLLFDRDFASAQGQPTSPGSGKA
jgi:hypothetical protein